MPARISWRWLAQVQEHGCTLHIVHDHRYRAPTSGIICYGIGISTPHPQPVCGALYRVRYMCFRMWIVCIRRVWMAVMNTNRAEEPGTYMSITRVARASAVSSRYRAASGKDCHVTHSFTSTPWQMVTCPVDRPQHV